MPIGRFEKAQNRHLGAIDVLQLGKIAWLVGPRLLLLECAAACTLQNVHLAQENQCFGGVCGPELPDNPLETPDKMELGVLLHACH